MPPTELTTTLKPEQRCPWCHEGKDPAGEGWVACPRDRTPAHVACVREFGICAICREPLDPKANPEAPAFPELVSARAIAKGVFVRPRIGGRRFGIEPLPGSVETQLAQVARDYRKREFRRAKAILLGAVAAPLMGLGTMLVLVPGGAGGVLLLGSSVLLLYEIATGCRGRYVPAPPAPGSLVAARDAGRPVRELARRIAAADRKALALARAHRSAVADADAAEAALASLERDPQELRREALEALVPIEGIGRRKIRRGTIARLRASGVLTLRDLARVGVGSVRGLSPKRRRELERWVERQRLAIERKVARGDFPEMVSIDAGIAADRIRQERAGVAAAERARVARDELIPLAEGRLAARAELDRELAPQVVVRRT